MYKRCFWQWTAEAASIKGRLSAGTFHSPHPGRLSVSTSRLIRISVKISKWHRIAFLAHCPTPPPSFDVTVLNMSASLSQCEKGAGLNARSHPSSTSWWPSAIGSHFQQPASPLNDEPDRNVNPCQIQLRRIFFYFLHSIRKINPYLNKKASQRKTIFCKLSATILTVRLTVCTI